MKQFGISIGFVYKQLSFKQFKDWYEIKPNHHKYNGSYKCPLKKYNSCQTVATESI